MVRFQSVNRLFGALGLGAIVLAFGVSASAAADIPPPMAYPPATAAVMVADLYDPTRFEVRFGGFMHGVGSIEKGTFDVNGELLFPKLIGATGYWSFLVPRLHVGANYNVSGRTNVVYAGFLWTVPITQKFFVEGFFDGAWTDGSLVGDATHVALGCRAQFHVGGSIGYRFDSRWSVIGTFDHVSNGSGIGLSNCGRNQGLNNYGVRVGYSF